MRIIGGKYGGRVLHSPKGLPVRPTTDRTKEALFNRLDARWEWEGMEVLDLFAGTGSLTLEFWSRGAARVVSVDRDLRCTAAIRAGLMQLGIAEGEVVMEEVWTYLQRAAAQGRKFHVVFMDPPYEMPGQEAYIELIMNELLYPGGELILEHSSRYSFAAQPGFSDVRKYGSSSLSFFERPEA
ncbi:MAG: RsmD family RNA methyltransferase [Bacteroidia bacterium]|nr:RsmD family RNA methyltransferase [Bacteroidia bacterium]